MQEGTCVPLRLGVYIDSEVNEMTISEVYISLCDPLNAGFGYQVRILDARGDTLLFTGRDPVTGSDLLTLADALRVAGMYQSEVQS
jgi:hypothetical protein